MSERVGAVHIAAYEAAIRKDERERTLALFEADIAKWRAYAPGWQENVAETVLLCADQIDCVIAKIRGAQ